VLTAGHGWSHYRLMDNTSVVEVSSTISGSCRPPIAVQGNSAFTMGYVERHVSKTVCGHSGINFVTHLLARVQQHRNHTMYIYDNFSLNVQYKLNFGI